MLSIYKDKYHERYRWLIFIVPRLKYTAADAQIRTERFNPVRQK